MFEILAHAVVLSGEEGGVEHDAERDRRVEEHVVNDHVQGVLEAEPELVVNAPAAATRAVTVVASLWNRYDDTFYRDIFSSSRHFQLILALCCTGSGSFLF